MPHDPSSEVGMYLFFCAEVRKGRRERGEGRLEGRRCEERKRERGRISGDVEERGGQKRGGGGGGGDLHHAKKRQNRGESSCVTGARRQGATTCY